MIVRIICEFTAVFLITWSAVFQGCYSQTTVVGPTDTVYVNPGVSASFNCSVTWDTTGTDHSIYWGISRDNGDDWTDIAQCYETSGNCHYPGNFGTVYSVESSAAHDLFMLTVTSPTLDQDGHYDCWPFEAVIPASPYARLYVLDRVDSVRITGYSFEETKTVTAGEAETFDCEATAGNPPAELWWQIGNINITDSSEMEEPTGTDTRLYDTTGSLLYRFNASDDGQYLRCQSFQHDSLTPMSWQILMDVLHEPVIQSIVADSWEGNTVVVECLATANPDDIAYSWESNDDDQTGDDTRKWTLTDEDSDGKVNVTCTATNSIGTNELTQTVLKSSSGIATACPTLVVMITMYSALTLVTAIFGL